MKQAIGKAIWNFAEGRFNLGFLAPIVVGWVVGSNGVRIK